MPSCFVRQTNSSTATRIESASKELNTTPTFSPTIMSAISPTLALPRQGTPQQETHQALLVQMLSLNMQV